MQINFNNNSINNDKKELELYVHIPFCVKKCAYCDFLSAPADEKSRFVYMEAMKNEIRAKAAERKQNAGVNSYEYIVTSIFVGGGTPTVLDGQALADLLACIKESFEVDADAEITFECNPGTADYEKLSICRAAGYNRISIGLQSAHDSELKALGRIHDYQAFEETYYSAVKCAFKNINVDLMSAIPGQTMESIESGLDKILSLNPRPQHISSYSLILEEDTEYWKMSEAGTLELPDEDTEREMHWRIIDRLEQEGYREYELSNLAIPGYECRHNVGYWIRKEYIGFGLGAASLVASKNAGQANEGQTNEGQTNEGQTNEGCSYIRQSNTRQMKEYLEYYGNCTGIDDKAPLSERIELARGDEIEEYMFLGLRMTEGISIRDFEAVFGVNIEEIYGEIIAKNITDGLLESSDGWLRLTRKGQDLANYVFSQLILG